MMGDHSLSRRDVMGKAGLATGFALAPTIGASGQAAAEGKAKEEIRITPPEDLMREHAVLERLLLIYEKALSAGDRPADWPMAHLADAARVVRAFIEDYHEKLEEEHLFPRFEQAGRLADLVAVLRKQHDVGRRVTDAVLGQLGQTALSDRQALVRNLTEYIRMYRPHAARESTVLFPQISAVVAANEYEEMGEEFEEIEHQKLGEAGFAGIVQKVAEMEKSLGIYNLAGFTPRPA